MKKCCIYKRVGKENEKIVPVIKYKEEVHTDKSDWYRTGWICSLLIIILAFVTSIAISPFIFILVAALLALAIILKHLEAKECDKKWEEIITISQNEENMKLREEYLEQRAKIEAEIEKLENTTYAELTPYHIEKLKKLQKDIRYEEYM